MVRLMGIISCSKIFEKHTKIVAVQSLSCVRLCDPMYCSTPGFPVSSPPPGVCSNSCPLSHLYHPSISSSVTSFSSRPQFFLRIRVFSNESALCIRWPKYWSFRFSINPSSEYSGLISFWIVTKTRDIE